MTERIHIVVFIVVGPAVDVALEEAPPLKPLEVSNEGHRDDCSDDRTRSCGNENRWRDGHQPHEGVLALAC